MPIATGQVTAVICYRIIYTTTLIAAHNKNSKLNFDIWSELTNKGFGTHVPSLYLQVCIIYMSVYIQPLPLTKDNFPT
jgi:hypothetical protein